MQMRRASLMAVVMCVALLLPRMALAHAHLVSSTPAASATVQGPRVAIDLEYNSRVDGVRSSISVVMPDGSTQKLTLDKQSGPAALNAHATLHAGHYTIQWMALAVDGHITRGEIPFSVQ